MSRQSMYEKPPKAGMDQFAIGSLSVYWHWDPDRTERSPSRSTCCWIPRMGAPSTLIQCAHVAPYTFGCTAPVIRGDIRSPSSGQAASMWVPMSEGDVVRPTGPEEMELLAASGYRRWPPRLPGQPILYPVLNEEYATQIARDWNVPQGGVGYVTKFRVRRSFLDRYEVQQVGGRTILEYWIPADDLDAFNDNIVGVVEVVAEFRD